MGITHSTPADGTFSGTGSTAWNADHAIAESGGQALTVGGITDGQFLKRVGTEITSATGTSFSTPTFPGSIPLTGVRYVPIRNTSVSTGDTDLYTVPAGKRALYQSLALMNNSGVGNIVFYAQVKVAGTYYRLLANVTASNGAVGTGVTIAYIAEPGEILSINTATNNGGCVTGQIVEFDNTCPVYSAKLSTLSAGDNTVYTVPALTTSMLLGTSLAPSVSGNYRYVNTSGGSRTIQWKITPSAGAATAITASTAVNDLASSTIAGLWGLGAGDSVQINTDANTATQMAWVNVMEIA